MIAWGKKIYRITPSFLRFVFTPAKLIYILIGLLRADQWILIGEEVRSKQQLAILYYGIERNKNYFANLAFGGLQTENYIGKRWLWQVSRKVGDNNCSLVVTEIHRGMRKYFQKKGNVYIPQWINLVTDISGDISSLVSIKSDLRRIRNHGLHFEVKHELSHYRYFYENMYVPYIRSTYGKMALLPSYQFFEREFPICELLLVKKGGKYIAGNLIRYKKNRASLFAVGVKDGKKEFVQEGALAAEYYFSICHLKEKGYKKVSFGGTRSFMKDGVLMYKKKWYPRIESLSRRGFLLNFTSMTEGVKGFLINNPFIYLDRNKLNGAIFVDNNQLLSEKVLEADYKKHSLGGLFWLIYYQLNEASRGIKKIVPPQLSEKITIRPAESLFERS